MSSLTHKSRERVTEIALGSFSRKEAAQMIGQGTRHLHSSIWKDKDPLVQVTLAKMQGQVLDYPWEDSQHSKTFSLMNNQAQENLNAQIAESSELFSGPSNRDRLNLVLGELTTNFFYHSFKDDAGNDKYNRKQRVVLSPGEEVTFKYRETPHGMLIQFEDNSGTFSFEDIRARLSHCYHNSHNLFSDNNHQGAGLGFYLIFEIVTHLSINVFPNKKTSLSAWLSPIKHFESDFFSFNFFEGSGK